MAKRSLFIVEDGKIKIGKVRFHKDLAENKDNVRGGGEFKLNKDDRTFTLFGKSHDFGPADKDEVQALIDQDQVWEYGKRNLCKMWGFKVGDVPQST